MSLDERDSGPSTTKWWGWGESARRHPLGPEARAMLRERLGPAEPNAPVDLAEVAMPAPRDLPAAVLAAARGGSVLTSHEQRVRRSAGKSYPDLIRLRYGRPLASPDAVVMPAGVAQLEDVITTCAAERVAVVPFGGGTSVVGGVDACAGPHERVIALDLRRLRRCVVDRESLTASLGPGLRGPEAEAALAAQGLTLGHFPQSFELATIGGFAATRSAGQASAGYGRFDELVTAVEMISPMGRMRTVATPHSAAGPALRELIVGSEGTLGAISDVTVRVRPAPRTRRYEAWIASDFAAGREAVRALAQADALADVTRLSDERETQTSLALAGTGGAKRALLGAYLKLRRRSGGCLAIVGWEGEPEDVERRRALSTRILRRAGLASLGGAAGSSWERGRYEGPYLRDELLDLGYFVETLETSHTWSRLDEHYRAVGAAIEGALEAQGTPGLVMCHVSHAYRDGASLYFTFIARRRPGEELEQWRTVKTAASEAIVAAGGTITHHHAVGRDHAPYMGAEVGELGLEALRAIKERLDPTGVMNPGKLIPPA